MIDVVIPFTQTDSTAYDLRYTLRSIQKYLPDFGNVFIIGDQPEWIQNHIHIPATDEKGPWAKMHNIYSKIMIACDDKRVSDDFYCSADDIFLLKTYRQEYNWRNTLINSIAEYNSRQVYRKVLVNTFTLLNGGYDIGHGPIIYNKQLFIHSVAKQDWRRHFGFAIKSLYINLNNLAQDFFPDYKIVTFRKYQQIKDDITGRPYFSSDSTALNDDLKRVIEELYPVKSDFEK